MADHGIYMIPRTGTQSWGSPYYEMTASGGSRLYVELYGTYWSMTLGDGSVYYAEGEHDGTTFIDYYGADWLSGMTGAMTTQAQALAQMAAGNFHTQTFEYDDLDRLIEQKQAAPDRVSLTDGGPVPNVPTTSYRYDGNGNLTFRKDPAGNETTYVYDNLDRTSSETTNAFLSAAQPNEPVTRSYTYADANFARRASVNRLNESC